MASTSTAKSYSALLTCLKVVLVVIILILPTDSFTNLSFQLKHESQVLRQLTRSSLIESPDRQSFQITELVAGRYWLFRRRANCTTAALLCESKGLTLVEFHESDNYDDKECESQLYFICEGYGIIQPDLPSPATSATPEPIIPAAIITTTPTATTPTTRTTTTTTRTTTTTTTTKTPKTNLPCKELPCSSIDPFHVIPLLDANFDENVCYHGKKQCRKISEFEKKCMSRGRKKIEIQLGVGEYSCFMYFGDVAEVDKYFSYKWLDKFSKYTGVPRNVLSRWTFGRRERRIQAKILSSDEFIQNFIKNTV